MRGTWELALPGPDGEKLTLTLHGPTDRPKGKIARGQQQADLQQAAYDGLRLWVTFPGKPLGLDGTFRIAGPVMPAADGWQWQATLVGPDEQPSQQLARRTAPYDPVLDRDTDSKEENPQEEDEKEEDPNEAANQDTDAKPTDPTEPGANEKKNGAPAEPHRALFEPNYPLGAFGRSEPPPQPPVVALVHATLWTAGPQGIVEKGSLLIRDGKIAAVGPNLDIPPDALVLDLAGKHVTPGIIDCHSHIATDGGINESAQAVTAEVRIGDFVDAEDINIYRHLAGGVTTVNVLHGSANPIGGQCQPLKLRWGALPEEMKFAAAPPCIKFALGENVKQSNWGDHHTSRYPQTRMGVPELVRDRFAAALEYRDTWRRWQEDPSGPPPRRDLELDALVEILEGKRLIHCHAYRQDEMLALMRVCEEFQVRIATFQHVLEGYKIADALRRHGAMASAFSDWWAYKFEVYDAIPFNGALMHRAGVVVSFNSDSRELARRLNTEAAKAVKYGGIEPHEALKFVTLNAARQMRIDSQTGSLEPGKDADLVVWSHPPLSTLARCEQTWIDGRRWFDLEEDARLRQRDRQMRQQLIRRILESNEAMIALGDEDPDEKSFWPREDLFCHHGHEHHDHHQQHQHQQEQQQ